MASLVYDSAVYDASTGAIDYDTDTFYMMLVTAAYVPDKKTHAKRSDVTDEVVGAGYVAGGSTSAVTVTNVTALDRTTVAFAATAWPASTITAAGAVLYKSRGGLASADELVAFIDFGGNVTSTAGTFTVTPSSPITYQN